jgi:hypothetical protein
MRNDRCILEGITQDNAKTEKEESALIGMPLATGLLHGLSLARVKYLPLERGTLCLTQRVGMALAHQSLQEF